MIIIPSRETRKFTQPNDSNKFGSVAYSRNMNYDEPGYAKLAPRMVKLTSDDIDVNIGLPVAIGKQSQDEFQIGTADSNYEINISKLQRTVTESTGASNPSMSANSHANWFTGLWHASTSTTVVSRPPTGGGSQGWTSRITGLTSGVQHRIMTFVNRNTICVTNGNVMKQYSSSYVDGDAPDLTVPSDFIMVGGAYNNSRMGIITRLNNDGTYGQDQDAIFFIWDGATTEATNGWGVGSDSCLGVVAYKATFAILTRAGELLEFNGGGFTRLSAFPFFFSDEIFDSSSSTNVLGNVPMRVDGDRIFINITLNLNQFGIKVQTRKPNMPGGIWCFDPKVGLYHRYSPSISQAYVNFVASAGVNTTTDLMTASAGVFGLQTIPATGGVARMTSGMIGGLTLNKDYYIIRVSATTFRLATTMANALSNSYIDLTSASDAYFWMYDLVDYGAVEYSYPGDVNVVATTDAVKFHLMAGFRLMDLASLAAIDALCVAVPFLENRGYMVTPRIFSDGLEDAAQSSHLKYRPLKDGDSIVIKYRDQDVVGLPVASSSETAVWTSPRRFYTDQNISEAMSYLNNDNGKELEIEITAGPGAGQMVQIESITEASGRYDVTLKEDVLGASSARQSEYIIDVWRVYRTITSTDDFDYAECAIGATSKFGEFKVELRGSEVTIEEMPFSNPVLKPLT